MRDTIEVRELVAYARTLVDGSVEKDAVEKKLIFLQGFLMLHWYGKEAKDGYMPERDEGDETDIGEEVDRRSTVDCGDFEIAQQTVCLRK